MNLPPQVLHALWRAIPQTAKRFHIQHALARWSAANRSLTERTLLELDRIPYSVEVALAIGSKLHGVFGPAAEAAEVSLLLTKGGGTALERVLMWLAHRHQAHGDLNEQTRRHYEHLISVLSKAHRRDLKSFAARARL